MEAAWEKEGRKKGQTLKGKFPERTNKRVFAKIMVCEVEGMGYCVQKCKIIH